jgi:SAM-dependent methyltransferase
VMALQDWIPTNGEGVLAKNGYALLTDLEDPEYAEIVRALEGFQAEFLSRTRPLWDGRFPVPPDALGHFTRQWEFPYAWANLSPLRGRFLDAGSGVTFFPFVFSAGGFEVVCCDADTDELGYRERFASANALTGCPVRYEECLLEEMSFPAGFFDAAACISVLEHVPHSRAAIVESLARVVRPGGRVVITCDVDLRRTEGLLLEDASDLLVEFGRHFELAFPLDLRRPPTLLTSESFLHSSPWRLPPPWRPPNGSMNGTPNDEFRAIAVLGITGVRRADG